MKTCRAAYLPHQVFTAPARRSRGLGRTIVGAVLIALLALTFSIVVFTYIFARYGQFVGNLIALGVTHGHTPGLLLLMFFLFFGTALAPMFVVRALHQRSAATLIGPPVWAWADFKKVAGVMLALQAIVLPVRLFVFSDITTPNMAFSSAIAYLPAVALALLVQSSAEELVFRGYLQQQLAVRFASPSIWIGIPSILFGLSHGMNGASFAVSLPLIVWATFFGVLLADLTARTGTLGAAIGFHFINNLGVVALIAPRGDLDGVALWTIADHTPGAAHVGLSILFAMTLSGIYWLAIRIRLRV